MFGFRGRVGGDPAEPEDKVGRKTARGKRKLERRLARLQEQNSALRGRLAQYEAGGPVRGIEPENVVWILGSGRTGSSWLTFMMGALPDHTRWNEPLVGHLFGHLYYARREIREDRKHFILAREYGHIWMRSLRGLVLEGGAARFPERTGGGYLVIKEPHGSLGAPLLMQALPESRMIFLVRDPKDVVASAQAASYIPTQFDQSLRIEKVEKHPEKFAADRAAAYLRDIQRASEAFDAHGGPKVRVRYEDLRADTLGVMRHIYASLEIPVEEEDLVRVVTARAWENVPEGQKGPDKRRRKASPGGWRDDLSPEQVEVVERVTAPVFDRFYRA